MIVNHWQSLINNKYNALLSITLLARYHFTNAKIEIILFYDYLFRNEANS